MSTPILLDLFCGAGGIAKGYRDAGFYVIGVDRDAQLDYGGNEFHKIDLSPDSQNIILPPDLLARADVIHASLDNLLGCV